MWVRATDVTFEAVNRTVHARPAPSPDLARNRYVISGAQIRKLAKPKIKKVGMISLGKALPLLHICASAEPAHRSIIAQNSRSEIFSVIINNNWLPMILVT